MTTMTNPGTRANCPPVVPGHAHAAVPDDTPYTPPRPSTASRKITLRSRGSLRGGFVAPDGRVLTVESHVEKDAALGLLARPDIVRLDDQPPAVSFVDRDGTPGRHTFDFLAHFGDGRRIYVAVKDDAHARKHDVVDFLRHVAQQIPVAVADGVMLVTEWTVSPAAKSNARLIQAVRRDPPHPADRAVSDLLPGIKGAVRVGDLVAATPYGAAAFRSIVRAVAARVLLLTADERIAYRSLVTVARDDTATDSTGEAAR